MPQKLFARLQYLAMTTAALLALSFAQRLAAQGPRNVTMDDIERMVNELSHWGRWGEDDQLGALNFITPEKRRAAAKLVKEGIVVSLARDAEKDQAIDNAEPFVHEMKPIFDNQWAVDRYSVDYHGYIHTHMDALCHLIFRDRFYNGIPASVIEPTGARKLGIENVKQGIFTRGILIDIPRLRGVDYLEPGDAIYPEELSNWENRAGVTVSTGDVVFIRTGRWARRDAVGPWDIGKEGLAGLHVSCARWFHDREVAMLGSDGGSDVVPSGVGEMSHPVHLMMLHVMGVHIFDNCDLEALSEKTNELKRWDFLITAAPLPVPGGTGSPLNPIATF